MVKYLSNSERSGGNGKRGGVSRRSFIKNAAAGGVFLSATGRVLAASKGGRLTIGVAASNSPDESLEAHRWRGNTPPPRLSALYDEFRVKDTNFKPVNRLLEHIESNADATEWTLRIPAGVEFHNGKSATADDVIFSLNRIVNPQNPMTDASLLASMEPGGMTKLGRYR